MKKEKTLQEVQTEIAELEEEKESYEIQLRQLKNREKMLVKLSNKKERTRRNHRLIQRGLIVERVVENPLIFTNEEIEKLFNIATHTEEYRRTYEEIISKKDIDCEVDTESIDAMIE